MAREILHTIYPFAQGTDRPISDWHYITIERETAKKAAGAEPFRVVWHAVGMVMEKRFTHITDACAALPATVAQMTEKHGGRDWSGLERCRSGWQTDNREPDLRKRGALNRMRADMGWSLERARLEYDNDPAQRF
jgi:hypothetical protein